MILKSVLLCAAFLAFTAVRAADDDDMMTYESADGICSKCNCTNVNGTVEDGESGRLFSLDCSRKSFQHLFAKWPEEMGVNQTDMEIIFIMSLSNIEYLQQFPATDAKIFFTCRHCKISGIQSHAFIDTPNIVSLDLSHNNIKSSDLFPEIFKGIENDDEYAPIKLQRLDLSHNQINSIEKLLFEHTPDLMFLDLSFNPFNQFDEPTEMAIGSLHQLEILDLSHTGIMDLSSIAIEHMKKLSEIFLNGNKFLAVPENLYTVGGSLEFLHLSGNPIEIIDQESFVGLTMVKQLNISDLPMLTEIKHNSLKYLTSLEVLHCHSNPKLRTFSMENLRELKHLTELDVSNNSLSVLDFGEIVEDKKTETEKDEESSKYDDQFKKLRILKLAGNPWICDCPIMKSLSLFDHNATYFVKSFNNDEARCASPSELTSKLLYDLPIEYVCFSHMKQKAAKIPVYDPPQFLRPKSIMLTVFSVVGVVILGVIIGFAIVCIKRRLKSNEEGYASSPIRYTTVRNSTIVNVANAP